MMGAAKDTVKEGLSSVGTWFKDNTRYFSRLMILFGPVLFMAVGAAAVRMGLGNDFMVVLLFAIAILWPLFALFLKGYSDRIGKGDIAPIPMKRFTTKEEDGLVTVRQDRVQEMILYLADVEDWLERKGMM